MGKQFKCGSWGHEPWPWGVDYYHASVWSRTRMGGWAVAQSPILLTTITLEMLDYYFQASPQLNEPLYPA
jgi:hypothetical protein